MYFEVFKFIVIFAGYELNPLKQVKYKTIYKMRKVSLALLLCLLCLLFRLFLSASASGQQTSRQQEKAQAQTHSFK